MEMTFGSGIGIILGSCLNRTIVEWKSILATLALTLSGGLNRTIVEWKLERGTEARSLKPEVWV